jgi:pantoate--beta-alanine ligase
MSGAAAALKRVESVSALRAGLAEYRARGERIAFVPTMGNLHAGHLALVAQARASAERVVCSIFVNPTQFGPKEDYSRYPRTLEADAAALAGAGADLLFLPTVEEMYPLGLQASVRVEVPGLSDVLCGAHRPGHFAGVATVVARLFNMVQPEIAVFGAKDFQQLAVIRHMAADLAFPISIVAGATVREPDGLAMSSRNQYLDEAERGRASRIYATLNEMATLLRQGQSANAVEEWAEENLRQRGFEVDYAAIREPQALAQPAGEAPGPRVALIAARLGRTRLIDNLEFELRG